MSLFTSFSPASLVALNVLFFYGLTFLTYFIIHALPVSALRSCILLSICASYLVTTPFILPHPGQYARLFMTTIAWVFALRTWEILNNAALESSIKGNVRHFCGYLHAFVDRKNPHLRDPGERRERFLRRTGRGILKLVGFHFASCTVPFLNGSEAAEFWAGTTYLSPSRYIATVLAGLIMYLWMGGIADVLFSIIEFLLRVRTRDMFERPYAATSLRAFWRWRWNGPFQECLARAIIGGGPNERVRYNEKEKVDEERNDAKPPSMSATMLAAFNIFLLSGVFHEHVNFVAFKEVSAQNCMFFLIQFVGLAMELQWSRTKMYKSLPNPLRWCAVLLFAALSGSLFVAPYMHNGGLKAFPFPDFGCVSWWPQIHL